MRIVSDRPIEILKSAVKEHLASVWADPRLLTPLFSPTAPPTRVDRWFLDQQMTVPVAKDSLQKRLIY
jgi:hypothetical protein